MTFEEAIKLAAKEVEDKFRDTLIDRAIYRLQSNSVSQYRDDIWEVDGLPSIHDYKASYFVTFDSKTKKYWCDCFNSQHGDVRMKTLCSHIVSVVIFRKAHRMLSGKGGSNVVKVVIKRRES